jgi:hypothetical protein
VSRTDGYRPHRMLISPWAAHPTPFIALFCHLHVTSCSSHSNEMAVAFQNIQNKKGFRRCSWVNQNIYIVINTLPASWKHFSILSSERGFLKNLEVEEKLAVLPIPPISLQEMERLKGSICRKLLKDNFPKEGLWNTARGFRRFWVSYYMSH